MTKIWVEGDVVMKECCTCGTAVKSGQVIRMKCDDVIAWEKTVIVPPNHKIRNGAFAILWFFFLDYVSRKIGIPEEKLVGMIVLSYVTLGIVYRGYKFLVDDAADWARVNAQRAILSRYPRFASVNLGEVSTELSDKGYLILPEVVTTPASE